jgi:hypothetical protein
MPFNIRGLYPEPGKAAQIKSMMRQVSALHADCWSIDQQAAQSLGIAKNRLSRLHNFYLMSGRC